MQVAHVFSSVNNLSFEFASQKYGLYNTRLINFGMAKNFQIVPQNTEALTEFLKDILISSERRKEKLCCVFLVCLFVSFLHSHYM